MTDPFLIFYRHAGKLDRADAQEKVLLHQPHRLKSQLKEFFRLLDKSLDQGKVFSLEQLAGMTDMSVDELQSQLGRVNWVEVTEVDAKVDPGEDHLPSPADVRAGFFDYYRSLGRIDRAEVENRLVQGLSLTRKAKVRTFLSWLAEQADTGGPPPTLADMASKAGMAEEQLVELFERASWADE